MAKHEWRCQRCKDHLFEEWEIESGWCDRCADAAYERSRAAADYEHWHPGERAPEIELPPMPPIKWSA